MKNIEDIEKKLYRIEELKKKIVRLKSDDFYNKKEYREGDKTYNVKADLLFITNNKSREKERLLFNDKENEAERIYMALIKARNKIIDKQLTNYNNEINNIKKELNM
jgi:hypothetical protein